MQQLLKTKILLVEFGLAWSANKKGLPTAMELTFVKTKHKKKTSVVFNKLCEFTKAFAGQRLHLVAYLGFLFYFRIGANVEDLGRVLLGIDKARLSLDNKKVPGLQLGGPHNPGYPGSCWYLWFCSPARKAAPELAAYNSAICHLENTI
ncbi:hypothetical protein DSO57_1024902 [Entomophthora muscae]|uniref:Uncharacterized protein n=1 Tax=Entomophthora muscae TaxID=34485 RepID=A0ACC2T2J2_9FUNG|nr:hypothetical protein DSO57_1024902 [Entomophthora muscae]